MNYGDYLVDYLVQSMLADSEDLLELLKERRDTITLKEAHKLLHNLRETVGWLHSCISVLDPESTLVVGEEQ